MDPSPNEKRDASLDFLNLVRRNCRSLEDFICLLTDQGHPIDEVLIKPIGWSQQYRGDLHPAEMRHDALTGIPLAREGICEELPDRLFVGTLSYDGADRKSAKEVWEERRRTFLPFDSRYWKTWGKLNYRLMQIQQALMTRPVLVWLFGVYGLQVDDHWKTRQLAALSPLLPTIAEEVVTRARLVEILRRVGCKNPKIITNVPRTIRARTKDVSLLGGRNHHLGVDWLLGDRITEDATMFRIELDHPKRDKAFLQLSKVIQDVLVWFAPVWTNWEIRCGWRLGGNTGLSTLGEVELAVTP